jgi:hypothetical protein
MFFDLGQKRFGIRCGMGKPRNVVTLQCNSEVELASRQSAQKLAHVPLALPNLHLHPLEFFLQGFQ